MSIPNFDTARLRSIAQQIIALEDQKDEIATDIKSFYASAKDAGFTPAILRKAIAEIRKPKSDERELVDFYREAIQGELFPEKRD